MTSFLQKIKSLWIVVFMVVGMSLVLPVIVPQTALAASPQQLACEGSGGKWSHPPSAADPAVPDTSLPVGCQTDAANGPSVPKTVTAVINILLFVIGVAAVIVIVVEAFRFVNSNGDSQAVSKSKNGIIFALVGLVVAALAYAIVNFVLDQL